MNSVCSGSRSGLPINSSMSVASLICVTRADAGKLDVRLKTGKRGCARAPEWWCWCSIETRSRRERVCEVAKRGKWCAPRCRASFARMPDNDTSPVRANHTFDVPKLASYLRSHPSVTGLLVRSASCHAFADPRVFSFHFRPRRPWKSASSQLGSPTPLFCSSRDHGLR